MKSKTISQQAYQISARPEEPAACQPKLLERRLVAFGEGWASRRIRAHFSKFFLVFASSLFLIFSYFLYQQVSVVKPHRDVDSGAYVHNAQIFCDTGSFVARKELPYYALGYPFFLAILYQLFGQSDAGVILVQILLALLAGFLIFVIARRLFNQTVALLSFLFFSCNLGFLVFAQFILTEIVLAFFLLLFVERLTAYFGIHKLSCLMLAGFFLGCSILIKPAALYYPWILLPLLLTCIPGLWLQRTKYVALFLFSFYLPVLGYMTHNYYAFDQFKVSSLDEVNMLIWFLPNVLGEKYGTDNRIEREKLQHQDGASLRSLFWVEFKSSPILFAYVWLKNVFKTWVGLFSSNLKVLVHAPKRGGDSSFFKTQGSFFQRIQQYVAGGTDLWWVKFVGWLEVFWSIIRFVLVGIAVIFLMRRRSFLLLYFFSSYFLYFSLITGHDGCARFRMMFEWGLIMLAAVGLWVLCRKKVGNENE